MSAIDLSLSVTPASRSGVVLFDLWTGILPLRPAGNWPTFSGADAKAYVKRIGNMVLMQAKQTSDLKSAAFVERREMFKASPCQLTSMVGALTDWTPLSFADRQGRLAKFALRTWPL